MTTKTPARTVVPPPADPRLIPHFLAVPPELEQPAEAVRAAIVREREAGAACGAAKKALDAAHGIDRLAAAESPDNPPELTRPLRERELQEAYRASQAAQDATTIAAKAQTAAIRPLVDDWRGRHEDQVRERVHRAEEQIAALIETFAEIQTDVTLDDALRDYAAGTTRSATGWHLEYRTPDVLMRQAAKAEKRMRSIEMARDVIPNEIAELIAAVKVQASAWEIRRDREKKLERRAAILAELQQAGVAEHLIPRQLSERVKAESAVDAAA